MTRHSTPRHWWLKGLLALSCLCWLTGCPDDGGSEGGGGGGDAGGGGVGRDAGMDGDGGLIEEDASGLSGDGGMDGGPPDAEPPDAELPDADLPDMEVPECTEEGVQAECDPGALCVEGRCQPVNPTIFADFCPACGVVESVDYLIFGGLEAGASGRTENADYLLEAGATRAIAGEAQ